MMKRSSLSDDRLFFFTKKWDRPIMKVQAKYVEKEEGIL